MTIRLFFYTKSDLRQGPGTAGGAAEIDFRMNSGGFFISRANIANEIVGMVRSHQVDGAAAKSAARNSSAEATRLPRG